MESKHIQKVDKQDAAIGEAHEKFVDAGRLQKRTEERFQEKTTSKHSPTLSPGIYTHEAMAITTKETTNG